MYLTIQIAVGIWLGGLFLFATATVSFKLAEKIAHNKRYGHRWWRGLLLKS